MTAILVRAELGAEDMLVPPFAHGVFVICGLAGRRLVFALPINQTEMRSVAFPVEVEVVHGEHMRAIGELRRVPSSKKAYPSKGPRDAP